MAKLKFPEIRLLIPSVVRNNNVIIITLTTLSLSLRLGNPKIYASAFYSISYILLMAPKLAPITPRSDEEILKVSIIKGRPIDYNVLDYWATCYNVPTVILSYIDYNVRSYIVIKA